MARRSATIGDVARDSGLSIKTVSRVLNDEPFVREDTRRTVMESVRKLNYQRNVHARGLRADASNIHALFYEDPRGGYHANILHGVLTRCQAEGLHLMVEMLHPGRAAADLQKFIGQVRLDGAVLTPPLCDDDELLALLDRYEVPVARLSPASALDRGLVVGIDDEQAAFDLTMHLLDKRHRRIGVVGGMSGHGATARRRLGYARALTAAGLGVDEALFHQGRYDFDSGLRAGGDLLRLLNRPTAIIAGNDETAAGIMAAAHRLGLRVPHDLSVCGFDDSPIARSLTPGLTTVRQPVRQMGIEAIRLTMSARAAGEPRRTQQLIMPHTLIERESVAALPA
ncbi:MAG: LacI family DNA-binding transcriptional regulator [Sphingomonas sp.]